MRFHETIVKVNDLSQPPSECLLRLGVESRVPLLWRKVTGDPDLPSSEDQSSKLVLNADWISVQPSEEVGDVDLASKLVDDDVLLALVAIPELRVRVLRIGGGDAGLFPSTLGLARSGVTIEDVDLTGLGFW